MTATTIFPLVMASFVGVVVAVYDVGTVEKKKEQRRTF